MILLMIFQIFHSLLSKDQTDHHGENKTVTKPQDLLGYCVGEKLTCCLVFTRSSGWKRSVEQVPLG